MLGMNDVLDLSVIGTPIRLHRNDEAAQYFDNGNHLITHETQSVAASPEELSDAPDRILGAKPSGGICYKEGIVLIDRYDARSLLQECEYSPAAAEEQKKTHSDCPIYAGDELDKELLEELMKERFGTLPEYEEIFCYFRTPLSSKSLGESIAAATECKTDQTSMDTQLVLTSEEQSQLPVGITLVRSLSAVGNSVKWLKLAVFRLSSYLSSRRLCPVNRCDSAINAFCSHKCLTFISFSNPFNFCLACSHNQGGNIKLFAWQRKRVTQHLNSRLCSR